jgi:transcription initiation factor TFIIIB Brf1 subunit/transcription initiation factor TFIIB
VEYDESTEEWVCRICGMVFSDEEIVDMWMPQTVNSEEIRGG